MGTIRRAREFQTPILLSRPPHPYIRGSHARRKTTASGQVEHAEGQCPTPGKRWVGPCESFSRGLLCPDDRIKTFFEPRRLLLCERRHDRCET
jgi:hypothetical protein